MSVLPLQRTLLVRPEVRLPAGWNVRALEALDVPGWLKLREAAFADQTPGVRTWTAGNFARELLGGAGGRRARIWVVEHAASRDLAGAIALIDRAGSAAVHWLMVHPVHRNQGLGQALIATCEAAAWDDGARSMVLETHSDWLNALRLYERCGYARANGAASQ